ncbi:hypothetical protein [Allosalinactinospora lopnorensis]|uniref:hypothetical protein n=1 Tax=Allosalinactinospora lopnorensis TaxID=1352348 RepID=UPI000623E7E7|nr:hypothetical protein [Allosalinactinospora lopnorensis]
MKATDPAHRRLTDEGVRVALADDPANALRTAATNMAFFVVYGYTTFGVVARVLIPEATQRGVPLDDARGIVTGRILGELN